MTTRILPLLAALAVLLSGCSSESDETTTSTTDAGTTDMPTTGMPTGPAGNASGDEYTCTAEPGGVVGAGGSNLATVSGCLFVTLDGEAVYAAEDIPAGCGSLVNTDGDNTFDGSPEVNETYEEGTEFAMGCGAQNPAGEGTITVRYL